MEHDLPFPTAIGPAHPPGELVLTFEAPIIEAFRRFDGRNRAIGLAVVHALRTSFASGGAGEFLTTDAKRVFSGVGKLTWAEQQIVGWLNQVDEPARVVAVAVFQAIEDSYE